MMLVRQVLCRQAIFRQVCMTALKYDSNSIGEILQINSRFGKLLLEERLLAGRSVRSIARRVKIKREDLRKWELGKSSPPARTFISIMKIYGREAMFRAAELDFQIQIEKYALVKEKMEMKQKVNTCTSEGNQRLAA